MAKHPHRCFGRTDVSDRERRLLQLNNRGPDYVPGGSPENGPCREQYYAPITKDGRGGRWYTLQFDSQKHADAWHQQLAAHKNQPGGNALLNAYAEKIAGGNPYPWIRTVGDAEYHNFNARHAANGTLVEPGYASNNRKNAETERAWNAFLAGRGPMPRDTRYQETGFRYRSANDVSYGPSPENPDAVAERGRRSQMETEVMNRWRSAEMTRREMRLALYNEAKRDGTDSYWGRVLRKFDAEFKVMADNKPDLTHGLQTSEQFDQWYNAHVTYLASVEKSVADWQRVLMSPVGTADVRTEEEKMEVLRQYDRTQVLFAQFAASYILADEMLHTTSRPPSERKQHVLKAIADLNTFGSHIYKYYKGQDVPKEQMDAYVKGTRAYMESTGALKKNEKLKVLMVTADEKGIQQLLELRTEMIGTLAFEPVKPEDYDIDLMNGYMVFMRSEREYLKRTGVENKRTEGIDNTIDSSSKTYLGMLGDRTNTLTFDIENNPQEVLVAASRELQYLQAYHPTEFVDRMKYLGNRDEGTGLGLIQKALNVQHWPLMNATDNAIADPNATQVSRLVAARAEIAFLKRHAGMMPLNADVRLGYLNGLEDGSVEKIFLAVMSKVNAKDPVGSVRAIESLYRENNDLAKRANKVELFKKFTEAFLQAARGPIREGVNAAITAVDTLPKDADDNTRVATIDAAINAIGAESKLLTDLGIDADRVALIQKKIPMIDTRIAVRQKQETELAPGAKKQAGLEDFRKVWEMLKGEEAAIRVAYARDPKTMNAKLAEVATRKESFKKTIAAAADSAVASLNEKTSTLDDASRAEALLRVTLHQLLKIDDKNEPFDVLARRIPDPDASTKMVTSYATIQKVRVAAQGRVDAERIAAEKKAAEKVAEEQRVAAEKIATEQRIAAEKLAAEQKLAAEKSAADKAVGTKAMKAVEDDAAAVERWRSKVSEMELGGKKLDVVDAAQSMVTERTKLETQLAAVRDVIKRYKDEKREVPSEVRSAELPLRAAIIARKSLEASYVLRQAADAQDDAAGAALVKRAIELYKDEIAFTLERTPGIEKTSAFLLFADVSNDREGSLSQLMARFKVTSDKDFTKAYNDLEREATLGPRQPLPDIAQDKPVPAQPEAAPVAPARAPAVSPDIVKGVQTLLLAPDAEGTFTLPKNWSTDLKEASLYVDGVRRSDRKVEDATTADPAGGVSAFQAVRETLKYYADFLVDGDAARIRAKTFKSFELRLDEKTVLRVEPQLPGSIAGYAVKAKDEDTLSLEKGGHSFSIRTTDDPRGYYLLMSQPDNYHIATFSVGKPTEPNPDELGFFQTLSEAAAALETKVGDKTVAEKLKDWDARNADVTKKLEAYFNADGSPTKALGWSFKDLDFRMTDGSKDYPQAGITLLRRDENFIRFSRPSDVRYDSDVKEYPTVEALIADAPNFLRQKELPPLASVLGRPLKDDDMRVLDERKAEVAALQEGQILDLIKQVRAYDSVGGDSWARGYVSQILPLVAPKSVRLLREYAQREGEYRRTGMLGFNAGFDATKVNAVELAEKFVAANPEDPVTLREAGIAMQYIFEREKARPLLEKALDKGDLVAGITLVAINEGSISGMRPYLKKVLAIARKENNDQPLIKEIEQQLAAMEKDEPEAPAAPIPE